MASLTTNSWSLAVDLIYPVGSIYISVNPTNPQILFGGNCVQIDQGRFLIASGDNYPVKSTGGEATHTLSIDELPAHDHSGTFNGSGTTSTAGAHTHTFSVTGSTNSRGGNNPHNNFPPYFAVYMWYRES